MRAAPKRGGSDRASQVLAAAPTSRTRATRCWRRSDSNHPTPADVVGRPAPAAGRRVDAIDVVGAGSGGSPRSSRCVWPNETIISDASANSANCAADRILDRNQFIELSRRARGRPTLTEFPTDEECGRERRRERIAYLCQLRRFFGRPFATIADVGGAAPLVLSIDHVTL